jgi:hypothetical protein
MCSVRAKVWRIFLLPSCLAPFFLFFQGINFQGKCEIFIRNAVPPRKEAYSKKLDLNKIRKIRF